MSEPLVSVVIPAFNEEHSLAFVLQGVREVFSKQGLSFEMIVVNDGSTDRTSCVAKEYDVVLIDNGRNLGKGAALRAGFSKAGGQIIVTMDADGSHQAEDIVSLVSPILNGDNVEATIGSRFIYDIGKDSTTKLHMMGNAIINVLIFLLTGRYLSDSQCGFRAFKREALAKLVLNSLGFDIETEITMKMLKNGFKVMEVPIRCEARKFGATRTNSFADGFKMLRTVVKAALLS